MKVSLQASLVRLDSVGNVAGEKRAAVVQCRRVED